MEKVSHPNFGFFDAILQLFLFGAVLLFPRGEKLWAFSLGRMRGPAPGPGPRLGLASEQPRSERFTSGGRIGVGALGKPLIKSASPRALSPFRRGASFDIEKPKSLIRRSVFTFVTSTSFTIETS